LQNGRLGYLWREDIRISTQKGSEVFLVLSRHMIQIRQPGEHLRSEIRISLRRLSRGTVGTVGVRFAVRAAC
jgi:hypothetical protein